jgi:hypothetical protein
MGKYTGVKRAVNEYNTWVGDAVITVDRVTNMVTCTVGESESNWPECYGLVSKNGLAQAGSKTSMREVRDTLARYEGQQGAWGMVYGHARILSTAELHDDAWKIAGGRLK